MKIKLPFKIGEEYENWEFDLEVLGSERIPFYDSYLYIGEVKKFLNFLPQKTELIFYWDRLEIVILTFSNMKGNAIEYFRRKLKSKSVTLTSGQNINCEFFDCKNSKLRFYLICKTPKTMILIYGNPIKIQEVYLNVLGNGLE